MTAPTRRPAVTADPELLGAQPELASARLESLLRRLVGIPSVNPDEVALAAFVADWLREHSGAEVHMIESLPGRWSVAAVLGERHGTSIVLNGHLDTVPVDDAARWTVDPFAGDVRDGCLYGRGACDMKGALAVQLAVAQLMSRVSEHLRGRLVLHFAIGEECAEPGTSSLLAAGFTGDIGVVGEPTSLRIGIASRGLLHARILIRGRSGHASTPAAARNPLSALPAVLAQLEAYAAEVAERSHELLPAPTCTPTMIHGGVKENAVSDECALVLDRRLLPGERLESELADIRGRLSQVRSGRDIEITVERITDGFDGVEVAPQAEAVTRLSNAFEAVTGRAAQRVGTPFASDVSRFASHGAEAVTFGAGSVEHCHCADEHIDLGELREAALVIAHLCCETLL